MRLGNDRASRAARLLFSMLMVLAWCGAPATAQPVDAPPPPAEDPKALAERMERLFAALEAADKQIPRETFDPKAVVNAAARDPTRLFEWVRDHTYWVPYRGALRGAAGTLMDRLGNSLDRSLLLAELCREAGQSVRLAHAELSDEQAAAAVENARPVPEDPLRAPAPEAAGTVEQMLGDLARRHKLDGAALVEIHQKGAALSAGRAAEAVRTAGQQTAALMRAVGVAAGASPDAPAPPTASEAARDHWWVQCRQGGEWVDLDVQRADASPGRSLATPVETVDLPRTRNPANIAPAAQHWHQVEIRVMVESSTGRERVARTVLSHALRPADIVGEDVTLAQVPLDHAPTASIAEQADPAAVLAAEILKQRRWLPVLSVRGTQVFQGSFDDAGNVDPKPNLDQFAAAGRKAADAVGGATGLFGGLPGAEPPAAEREEVPPVPAPASVSVLTAAWIEYEIRVPGAPPRVERRDLFDLIGPAARASGGGDATGPELNDEARLDRGLALLGHTQILVLPCALSQEFVTHLENTRHLANRRILPPLIRESKSLTAERAVEGLTKLSPSPGPLYGLALARHAWSPARAEVYLDRPNVFTYRAAPRRALDDQGGILLCHGVDIVANEVAVRRGAAIGARDARLAQGVIDTVAEAAVVTAGCCAVDNTASLFERAGGGDWITVRGVDDPAWRQVELPPDARARIEQDLRAGHIVMVPPRPVEVEGKARVAWWRVDAGTGDTLGINAEGRGASTVEYVIAAVRVSLRILTLGVCLASAVRSDWSVLGKLGGIAACMLGYSFGTFGAIGRLGGAGAMATGTAGAIGDAITLGYASARFFFG